MIKIKHISKTTVKKSLVMYLTYLSSQKCMFNVKWWLHDLCKPIIMSKSITEVISDFKAVSGT